MNGTNLSKSGSGFQPLRGLDKRLEAASTLDSLS